MTFKDNRNARNKKISIKYICLRFVSWKYTSEF